MTQRPIAFAITMALASLLLVTGCDRTAGLTEQEHIQRAKDFEDQGNLKGSIIELKNAIQKNPESPQARLLLGQVYLKAGKGAEAEKELLQAEKLGVSRETIKLHLGEAWLLMGENRKVLDQITASEKTSTESAGQILRLRADALFRERKISDACNLYQQAKEANPKHAPTYWGLAQCSVAERDNVKAMQQLNDALKIPDRQAKTWIFVGDLQRLNGDAKQALDAYANALKAEPDNLEALQSHATINLSLGNMELAKQDLDRAKKLAPNTIGSLYLQALYDFHQKKYAQARDTLQEILKLSPDHVPSVLLAGATYFALGSYQQAETQLSRILSSFPGHPFARQLLAATLIKQQRPDEALKTLGPLLTAESKNAKVFTIAGEAYLLKKDAIKAASFLERASALDPENASIQTQLGLSNLLTGNLELAQSQLQSAATLDSRQYQADAVLIQTHLKNKQYDRALAAIANLEKKLPDNPLPHLLRGRAYLGKKDVANARASFERALAIDPAYFPAAGSLATLDMADKKPESARKRFEAVLEKDRNNLDAMIALAQWAALAKQEQESIAWLERAAKAHPKAIEPRLKLASYYLAKQQGQKALTLAREAQEANPASLDALSMLGAAQLAVGEKESALVTFTRLAEAAPQSPRALFSLAQVQQHLGKNDAARATLKKALAIDPRFPPALDALMVIEASAGRIDEALRIARQIQAAEPKSPQGFMREGDILLAAKRYIEASRAYQKALSLGESSALMTKWHEATSRAGDARNADVRMQRWLQQHPEDLLAQTYLAQAYASANRDADAIAMYEAIRRLVPNNAQVLNNLANLYWRSKDKRALATVEQAWKLAPDNAAVLDTFGWILVEQGQTGRGLELLRKAAAQAPNVPTVRYHLAVALARNGDKAQARAELEKLIKSGVKFPEMNDARALHKSL